MRKILANYQNSSKFSPSEFYAAQYVLVSYLRYFINKAVIIGDCFIREIELLSMFTTILT